MRWFKHLSEASHDEKLASLLALHGPEGYGVWWLIVEAVTKQIPPKSKKDFATYPVSYWLRITGLYHHKKFKVLIESMNNLCIISAQSMNNLCTISELSTKDLLTISIPNILKYRDEYSKKSVVCQESV